MTNDKPSKVSAMAGAARRCRSKFIETYCTVDPEASGSVASASGASSSTTRRGGSRIATWYSNEGLLPNHTVLWRPSSDYMFSLLLRGVASRGGRGHVRALRARLLRVHSSAGTRGSPTSLSFVCMVSLHDRCDLPRERRGRRAQPSLRVDAVLADGRALLGRRACGRASPRVASGPPTSSNDGAAASRRAAGRVARGPRDPARALGHLLLQRGEQARLDVAPGLAVHYVLYQERMITWFGLLLRSIMTVPHVARPVVRRPRPSSTRLPFLLLSPFGRVRLAQAGDRAVSRAPPGVRRGSQPRVSSRST